MKERGLPASELLRQAVQAELRRQDILAEADRYIEDLSKEVGEPSPAARRKAERLVREVHDRSPGS